MGRFPANDERIGEFLNRPPEGEWRSPSGLNRWRHDGSPLAWRPLPEEARGRIVSVAAMIAVAANREAGARSSGLHIGPAEAFGRGPSLPNKDSIVRLIGAVLLEASDEWQPRHRSMQIEAMAELDAPPKRASPSLQTPTPHDRQPPAYTRILHQLDGRDPQQPPVSQPPCGTQHRRRQAA